MTGAPASDSVRRRLVQATTRVHHALHRDPVLARLSAPDLTLADYLRALQVFASLHAAVEHERRHRRIWGEFSLQETCAALANDLDRTVVAGAEAKFASDIEVLGGLYVAHGAVFGRAVFRENVMRILPMAPRRFLSLPRRPNVWRGLLETIDIFGPDEEGGLDGLIRGAAHAFGLTADVSAQIYNAKNPTARAIGGSDDLVNDTGGAPD